MYMYTKKEQAMSSLCMTLRSVAQHLGTSAVVFLFAWDDSELLCNCRKQLASKRHSAEKKRKLQLVELYENFADLVEEREAKVAKQQKDLEILGDVHQVSLFGQLCTYMYTFLNLIARKSSKNTRLL